MRMCLESGDLSCNPDKLLLHVSELDAPCGVILFIDASGTALAAAIGWPSGIHHD